MKFCSKCGTQLSDDAVFCSSCGARMEVTVSAPASTGADGMKPGVPSSANGGQDLTEVAGNVVANLTNTVNQALNSEKGQEYLTSSKLGNIGYAAAVLGAVSVFFPVVSFGGLGGAGSSILQDSKLIGLLIIFISLFGAYGVNVRKYAMTLASGQALLVLSFVGFAAYSKLNDHFFGRLMGYDLGVYLPLLSGIAMVFLAGFLSLAVKQVKPDIGGVINEIRSLEISKVEINGMSINAIVLTVGLLAIVFLGTALS